jgi:methionine-rich copper-binding protein CopC
MRQKLIWLIGLALLLTFKAVSAHEVTFLQSNPENGAIVAQSPAQIRALFDEELQTGVSILQVFNADGQRVDSGDGQVDLMDPDHASLVVNLPPLPDGAYWVRWYIVLLDGDASESSFNFFVGQPEAAAAAGFAPADDTIFYYQAESENTSVPWLITGGGVVVLIALVPLLAIVLRRGSA